MRYCFLLSVLLVAFGCNSDSENTSEPIELQVEATAQTRPGYLITPDDVSVTAALKSENTKRGTLGRFEEGGTKILRLTPDSTLFIVTNHDPVFHGHKADTIRIYNLENGNRIARLDGQKGETIVLRLEGGSLDVDTTKLD